MDALSMKVLSIGNTFTFRNIANWLNYCATLNYQNMNCFNLFERVVITKIKAFELNGEKRPQSHSNFREGIDFQNQKRSQNQEDFNC